MNAKCFNQLFLFLWPSTVLYSSNFNCSYCTEHQLIFISWTSTVHIASNSTVLISVNINCSYYVELQLFLLLRTSTVLIASNSTVLIAANSTVLIAANSTVLIAANSTVLIAVNSTVLITANLTVLIYIAVSCIKSLHYSVDTGLCITLQLWNTVAHINPMIMLPNILKERSPYFLIFCINLFTTSTINNLAGNSKEGKTFCIYYERPPIM